MADNDEQQQPRTIRRPAKPMGLWRELWAFLRVRKKFWLAPIIISLVLLSLLIWLSGSLGVVSPLIYAL